MKKWRIHRLSLVVIILFAMFLVCYAAKDAAAFDGGVPISDIEMEETHGGFQMPNGNFFYFNMDFMHMEYFAHNDPSSAVTPASILGDESGLFNNTNDETLSIEGATGVIHNYVANNTGLTNVGVILGDNNKQFLINYLNVELAIFEVSSPDLIKPVLSNWLHLAL